MNGMSKEVIFQYFSGQSTTLQKRLIERWLEQTEHVELYYEWLEEWETIHPQYVPDLDRAFAAFNGRINCQTDNGVAPIGMAVIHSGRHAFYKLYWMTGIAASLFILLFSFKDTIQYRHYRTGNGEVRNILLKDESVVLLNANSDLKVSRFFNFSRARQVTLSGEAIFDVKHTTDSRPFIVTTANNWKIRVLGTEFNVYARRSGSKVFLSRGSIQLMADKSSAPPLLLKPGDLVVEDAKSGIRRSAHRSPQEFGSWKDHLFVFNATSLSGVAQMLEDQFGKKIVIEDTSLANRTISGSFKWAKEEDVLIALSVMMKFNVIQLNDSILLK